MRYESFTIYIIEIYINESKVWVEFERFLENDSYDKIEKKFKFVVKNFNKSSFRLSKVKITPIILDEEVLQNF